MNKIKKDKKLEFFTCFCGHKKKVLVGDCSHYVCPSCLEIIETNWYIKVVEDDPIEELRSELTKQINLAMLKDECLSERRESMSKSIEHINKIRPSEKWGLL